MVRRLFLFKEALLFAGKALRVNLLRTVLSLLGVTVGILSIVGTSAFFDSIEKGLEDSFSMIGDDLVFIQKWPMGPEEGDEEYAWWKYMRRRNPRLRDAEQLSERLTTAEAVAFQVNAPKTVVYRNNNLENVPVAGISYSYDQVISIKVDEGRYFTEQECDAGRPVAIIGDNVRAGLFPNGGALGKKIKVGGTKMEIIGTLEPEGNGLLPQTMDDVILVNVNFITRLVEIKNSMDVQILVKAKQGVETVEMKDEVVAALRPIRGVKPGQDNDFSVMEASFIMDAIDNIFGVMDIVSVVIGIFALLVGGFGILNIMFVSVRERTNQIGIQKSLGARNAFILSQFLMESVFLCMIGAVVALLMIWGLLAIAELVFGFELVLSMGNLLYGMTIATVLGLLAGFLPARKASRMNPVEAIRFK